VGHRLSLTARTQITWSGLVPMARPLGWPILDKSSADSRCHFVLLDKDESCPTADLSNIGRPNGSAYSSVSRHFLLQALQCPCFMQKRFSGETTVVEEGQNLVSGLWGRTLGGN